MATPFKISINEPCKENWNNMQENQNGRFCSSCQKSVFDFTQFSDAELSNWFIKNQGKTCGKFKPDQLNRLIANRSNFSLRWFKPNLIAASLIAFLTLPKLSKATNISPHSTYISDHKKPIKEGKIEKTIAEDFITIKGNVVDHDEKQPIVGAGIRIKGSKIVATTDSNGDFELKLQRKDFKNDIVVQVGYIGYEGQNVKVKLKKTNVLVVKLKMATYILGGLGIIKQPLFINKMKSFLNG